MRFLQLLVQTIELNPDWDVHFQMYPSTAFPSKENTIVALIRMAIGEFSLRFEARWTPNTLSSLSTDEETAVQHILYSMGQVNQANLKERNMPELVRPT